MKKQLAAAVAVLVMSIAPMASAQRVRASAPPAPSQAGPIVIDPNAVASALTPCMLLLNLTPAQRTQIQGILTAAQPVFEQLGNRIAADQDLLNTAAGAANVDACAVGNAYVRRQNSLKALEVQVRLVRNQIDAVLTADQKARLEGCISAMLNMFPGRP